MLECKAPGMEKGLNYADMLAALAGDAPTMAVPSRRAGNEQGMLDELASRVRDEEFLQTSRQVRTRAYDAWMPQMFSSEVCAANFEGSDIDEYLLPAAIQRAKQTLRAT